jgi:hypothetical protein
VFFGRSQEKAQDPKSLGKAAKQNKTIACGIFQGSGGYMI